jgi:hypothetical protein
MIQVVSVKLTKFCALWHKRETEIKFTLNEGTYKTFVILNNGEKNIVPAYLVVT